LGPRRRIIVAQSRRCPFVSLWPLSHQVFFVLSHFFVTHRGSFFRVCVIIPVTPLQSFSCSGLLVGYFISIGAFPSYLITFQSLLDAKAFFSDKFFRNTLILSEVFLCISPPTPQFTPFRKPPLDPFRSPQTMTPAVKTPYPSKWPLSKLPPVFCFIFFFFPVTGCMGA